MDALNYKTGRDPNGVSRFGLEFYRFVENLISGYGHRSKDEQPIEFLLSQSSSSNTAMELATLFLLDKMVRIQ